MEEKDVNDFFSKQNERFLEPRLIPGIFQTSLAIASTHNQLLNSRHYVYNLMYSYITKVRQLSNEQNDNHKFIQTIFNILISTNRV
jgi:hypothetical protein